MRIISTNDADSAVLTSSDFVGTLPVTNLQLEGRARVARTANTAGDKTINGNWASPKIAAALVLYGCNFTSQATVRIQLWDGANQTGGLVYDSGAVAALDALGWGEFGWGMVPWGATVFDGWESAYSVKWFPQMFAVRSWRITLNDAVNPAGYIQIKRLLIGPYFEPQVNPEYGMQLGWQDNSVQTRMYSGALRTDAREMFRSLTGTLGGLGSGERAAFMEISRRVGLKSELFVSVFPETGGSNERDHSLLCKFDQLPKQTHVQFTRYSGQFSFVEV